MVDLLIRNFFQSNCSSQMSRTKNEKIFFGIFEVYNRFVYTVLALIILLPLVKTLRLNL